MSTLYSIIKFYILSFICVLVSASNKLTMILSITSMIPKLSSLINLKYYYALIYILALFSPYTQYYVRNSKSLYNFANLFYVNLLCILSLVVDSENLTKK